MPTHPEILVLAGVNGAGKSSIAGAALERQGVQYYNPDRAARRYLRAGLSVEDATSRAWHRGREQLERAIAHRLSYAFETTLGGRTMTRLLLRAADGDHRVRVWYVGLSTLELHIERVRARVDQGGHDIPDHLIRSRWESSRENLVRLIPHVSELDLYDNSADADPSAGTIPRPARILHARDGAIDELAPVGAIPTWAKAPVAMALATWA